jgi:hypothetical protein
MLLIGRHLAAVALVATAVLLTGGFFVFARPQYRPPNQGEELIKVPTEHPAADAPGAAGWVWAKGTPGWAAGTLIGKHHDYNISGVQPVELTAAEVAAAHAGLDSQNVLVIDSMRASKQGPLAILAAPMLEETPARTCLLALLPGDAPLTWRCPGTTTSNSSPRVLVAAAVNAWPSGERALTLVGVARGDVRRVVLDVPGVGPHALYDRGTTWGQFGFSVVLHHGSARLFVYGDHGLVQTLPLTLARGEARSFS